MMMTRRSVRAGIVLETLVILIGLGLLAKAAVIGTATYKFTNNVQIQSAQGTIVGTGPFGLMVQYNGQQDGIVFRQKGFFLGRSIGQQVRVIYDPNKPQMAAINEPMAIWFGTMAPGVLAALFLILGFHLRTRRSL